MIKLKDLLKETYKLSLKDLGDGNYKVVAIDNGKNIGELQFIKSKFKPVLKGASVVVDPNYQRQGIGSAMYVFAEKQLKLKFVKTDDVLTGSGKALWNDPNRKFGLKELVKEMEAADLRQVEKYADKELDPVDVDFAKHFFDQVNNPRNGKDISSAELIGFFKRLSKNKKKFIEFIKKYQEFVVKDDKTDINIPFVSQVNKVLAKTIMRKHSFSTTNPVFSVNESAHDQALSYTEEQALELAHKNWSKFTGKVCNTGFCDIYASKLSKLLPGSKQWDTEEQGPSGTLGHVWVEFKGKFYDAETPDGVSDWKELPWMQEFYKAKKQYPSDIKQL